MKPWQKDSSDPMFNEFYTTKEICDIAFCELLPIIGNNVKVCCPCDSEHSEIVKYFKAVCPDWDIDHFSDLDVNSEEARSRMLKADVVITNPPYKMDVWKPFIEWLIANKKQFFVFGPLLQGSGVYRQLLKHVTENSYIYKPSTHRSHQFFFDLPNGTQKPAITIFYTSYKVPTLDYKYKPAEEQYYEDVPVYDRLTNIPHDYMGWMYVPVTSLHYLQPFEIDVTRPGVPGKYSRVCLRRRAI